MMENQDEGAYNPFLNHLVIENIVTFVNRITELKNVRSISTQWNDLVRSKLMQKSIVTIKCHKDMDRYLKDFNGTIQHKNFHWKATGIDLNNRLLQRVLKSADELHLSKGLITIDDLLDLFRFGGQLKTLSFNEVFVEEELSDDEHDNENDMTKVPKETPARKEMTLHNLNRLEVTSCDSDDNFPWAVVLAVLPHLKVLHAQLQSTSQVTNLLEALLANHVKLSEFSCFLVDMNEEHMQLLECLEMPLKVVDISIASTVSNSAVDNLLGSKTCSGLEILKIFKEADCGHKNSFYLAKLEFLKSLEILGDPVSKIFVSLHSTCPNLTSLNLGEVSCKDVMSQKSPHMNLKSLCIEECFFPTNVLAKLADSYPNLIKLCLFLNDDNVGVVFQKFGNLEELTILGTEISDDGITGGRDHKDFYLEAQRTDSHRPFVGDCKKLRVLNFYPQPLHGISDLSIYYGFIFIQELTSLTIPETTITNSGLRSLLKSKANLVKLSAKVMINSDTDEHFLRNLKYQIQA